MSESIYPIITRKEAKAQGLKRYFNGRLCPQGHISEKYVSNGRCVGCSQSNELKEYEKNYRKTDKNKEYRNSDEYKEYQKEYSKEYQKSDKSKEYHKEYRKSDEHKETQRKYRKSVEHKESQKNRRTTDPLYRLSCDIRSLIRGSMKRGGFKKSSKTAEMLGCSFEFFKQYIENQFTEGMTWENHGKWHYDHIYPVAKRRDEAHLIELNHYSNFQPLWAEDNLTKGAKIPEGY